MKTFKPGERIRSSEMNANFTEVRTSAAAAAEAAAEAKRTADGAETKATENRRVIQQQGEYIQSQGRRLNELEARPAPSLAPELVEDITLPDGWTHTYAAEGSRIERIGPLRRIILTARLKTFTAEAAGAVLFTIPEGSRPMPQQRPWRFLGMGLIEYSNPTEYVPVPLVVGNAGSVKIATGHTPTRRFMQITAEILYKAAH